MNHVLRHFSIVDITHHAEIESLTGKVKFQFGENSRASEGMEHYIVIDVVIAASKLDTLETIRDSLLEKATAVMQSALAAVHQVEGTSPTDNHAGKPH